LKVQPAALHKGTLAGVGLLLSAMATPMAVPMLRDGTAAHPRPLLSST